MSKYSVGDMIVSLCGHDKDEYFIVIGTEEDYVTICDGKRRKAENKKRKKNKHIKPTGLCADLINVPQYATDAAVRREIKRLKKLL